MVRRAKSLFITLYVVALVAGTAYAAMGWNAGGGAAWFGALVTWAAPAAALTTLVLLRRPRSSAHLPLVLAAVASGLVLALVAGSAATDVRAIVVAVTGAASFAAYNFWYSRFGRLPSPSLKPGAVLPAFELVSADGRTIDSAAFAGRPWLLLFHRGNWCPFCIAQVRELAANYRALSAAGVGLAVISPQSGDRTADLSRRFDVAMEFYSDPGARAAGMLGIDAPGGLPAGLEALGYASDTVLPTAILIDEHSRVVWRDETDNYRMRPEPETFLRAARQLGVGLDP